MSVHAIFQIGKSRSANDNSSVNEASGEMPFTCDTKTIKIYISFSYVLNASNS